MAPHIDDSVNRQNYKTEYRPLCSALLAAETDDDDDDDAEIAADVTERTGWKTGPASVINDTRQNIHSSYSYT